MLWCYCPSLFPRLVGGVATTPGTTRQQFATQSKHHHSEPIVLLLAKEGVQSQTSRTTVGHTLWRLDLPRRSRNLDTTHHGTSPQPLERNHHGLPSNGKTHALTILHTPKTQTQRGYLSIQTQERRQPAQQISLQSSRDCQFLVLCHAHSRVSRKR